MAEDIEGSRAFVGLAAVLDRTSGHVGRGSERKLLTPVNWIAEYGIQVDMDAAYALLPSGLAALALKVSATCPRRESASQDLKKLDHPASKRPLPEEE